MANTSLDVQIAAILNGDSRLRLSLVPAIPSQDAVRRMLADRVDDYRRSLGMIVGITDGKSHLATSYDRGDVACGRRIDEATIFEIGSVTKLFDCPPFGGDGEPRRSTIGRACGRPLAFWYASPKPQWTGNHASRSGIALFRISRRPTNLTPNDPTDPYAHYTADHLYEFLATYELTRTPGDTYEYSHVGAGLLGHALAVRAGNTDYESLVRARILGPLRMDDTVIAVPHRLRDRVAVAHDDNLDPVPDWNLGVLAGAGGFHSSLSDLLLFLDALCDQDSPIASMVSPLIAGRAQGGMELGWPHPDGGIAISHWGATGGSRSFVRCIPEWKRGVVVLSNAGIDAVVDLGVHVLDKRFARHWFPRGTAIDPVAFVHLVGRYQAGPNTVFEVTTRDGRLYVQRSGQSPLRAFPMSEWRFFHKAVNAQLTFEPGGDSYAARLVLHQNGSDQT